MFKRLVSEFKEFALKGNVIDLAVGVVIGAAFKSIVDAFVTHIISPSIGLIANKDLSAYAWKVGEASIGYGALLTAIINFLIIAVTLFVVVKSVNKLRDMTKKKEEEAEPTTKVCPYCKNEIHIEATRCGFCTAELDR